MTETPLTILSFVWLGLLVVDLTAGLPPALEFLSTVIWVLFGLDFLAEFVIAPDKLRYLRRNWMTVLALLLPAARVLRVFRAFRVLRLARAARPLGLLRIITSLNRGLGAVRRVMRTRGVGYVLTLTLLVLFAGAAGMAAFENPRALAEDGHVGVAGLPTYGEALWWTAMVLATIGTDYWPVTSEGRVLCFLLALYGFAVFGYLTATLASFFLGRDARAGGDAALAAEIKALRAQVEALRPPPPAFPGPEAPAEASP